MSKDSFTLSVVVPLYNEAAVLRRFHTSLLQVLFKNNYDFEVIYCDDGSEDNTAHIVQTLAKTDKRIKLLKFSRNFGKENALSAGISHAVGDAVIMLDGDGQHPPDLIPDFVNAWQAGSKIVVGLRANYAGDSLFGRVGSWGFYKLFSRMSSQKLVRGTTDFRLIDKTIRKEFLRLSESNRITRGLLDWIGFTQTHIPFTAPARADGKPGYGHKNLVKLALNGFISLSPTPLYVFGYVGLCITAVSFLSGVAVLVEQVLLGDPLGWRFTGTAMLGIMTLFLVGIVLLSQGVTALYVAHIHNQSKRRPLYVIDRQASVGIDETVD